MDFSTIMYIIIFLAIAILIFKVIKKIIFAVITLILFVFLIFAGMGTLAYYDYKGLTQLETFNVNVVYGDAQDIGLGVKIPFENKEIIKEEISSLDISNLDEEYLDDVDEENGNFYILISKELFENTLNDEDQYYLTGTEGFSYSGLEVETSLNKEEVLFIIDSEESLDEYTKIILSKNDFPDVEAFGISPTDIIADEIQKNLNSMELREALFLSILSESSDKTELLVGFKEGELKVYPEKFSFKLLKIVPLDMLKENLPVEATE